MISAIVTLAVALASSAYSGAVASIRTDFNINNEEVLILGRLFQLSFRASSPNLGLFRCLALRAWFRSWSPHLGASIRSVRQKTYSSGK